MHRGIGLTEIEFNALTVKASQLYNSRIEKYMFRRSIDVVEGMLADHNRIFAFRVDLRFAQDYFVEAPDSPFCFQRTDPQVITRFLESLKSQLKAEHKRSGRKGTPALPAYVWTRERNHSDHFHYHVMLIFNRDVYGYLGDYTKVDADNMSKRVQKAWCSAIGLEYPDYTKLVQFPSKSYKLDRNDAILISDEYALFLLRMAYLTKENTKNVHDSYRNFGFSQI